MEVVDVKKLETALQYIKRITEGKNPVNNMPAEDDSIINNPNVLRCMFFVKEVLEEVQKNEGYIGRKPKKQKDADKEEFPVACLDKFEFVENKPISRFTDQLNSYIDTSIYKKVTYRQIRQWLIDNGYLKEVLNQDAGRTEFIATAKGSKLDIGTVTNVDANGRKSNYATYGKKAQEYVVANMDKILKAQE